MTFLFPSLALLGAMLVLVPLVVHLISRRRRKRIRWSAMEFLLESSKRNRNRSRLEELLLLLMRMLAIGIAGLLAAVPQLPEQLSGWFTGEGAKHLVILDDSYSMSEQIEGDSPWGAASAAINRLLDQSTKQGGVVHLIKYSGPLSKESVDDVSSLNEYVDTPSKLAVSATDSLLLAKQWLETNGDSQGSYYVTMLSDFRRHDHADDADFQAAVESLAASAKDCLLASCATIEEPHDNRSLVELKLLPGPRAVDVEARAQVTVANRSDQATGEISIEINHNNSLLTSVELGPFQPGEVLTRTFPLLFKEAGVQVLGAQLPDDSISDDNRQLICVDIPAVREVLVLDGSNSPEAIAYAAALAPHPSITTGWQATVVSLNSFDASTDLSRYAAIFILDPTRLNRRATESIQQYVQQGGGLFIALGPNADPSYFNSNWFQGDPQLMPNALDLPTQAETYDSATSFLQVSDHPSLRVLLGQRNGFLPLIRVNRFYGLQLSNQLRTVSNTSLSPTRPATQSETLLRLPTGEPLLVEHAVENGRVMAMLTMVTKPNDEAAWSNLATLPIFPVMVNEFASWLCQTQTDPIGITVGSLPASVSTWEAWRVDERAEDSAWQTLREESAGEADVMVVPGAYRVSQLGGGNQASKSVLFAANTDPAEGELEAIPLGDLRDMFGEVAEVLPVDEVFITDEEGRSWETAYMVALGLLALLILERILAMRCSHLAAVPGKSTLTKQAGRGA